MNTFVTHPSVRIKGTENHYDPIQCIDPLCAHKPLHMHCPFCVKTESYHDPVILRAHYRVKHVDKGIDFAGLKILRCCDHCDIVGAIKGVKEFKGAHWHCYKCKNGFNRRDEAIKHYRTHFRNPQTTFQIQITQEVNQTYPLQEGDVMQSKAISITQDELASIHPVLTDSVMTTGVTDTGFISSQPSDTVVMNGKSSEGEMHVPVAANETVDTSEGQTIMIIHEDELDQSTSVDCNHIQAAAPLQLSAQESVEIGNLLEQREQLEQQLADVQNHCRQIELQRDQMEQELRQEIEQLRIQVQTQAQDISNYQKREAELMSQLSIPLDSSLQDLLQTLKTAHEELLHQQLAALKRSYNPVLKYEPLIMMSDPKTTLQQIPVTTNDTTDPVNPEIMVFTQPINETFEDMSSKSHEVTHTNDAITSCTSVPVDHLVETSEHQSEISLTTAEVEECHIETLSTDLPGGALDADHFVETEQLVVGDVEGPHTSPPSKRKKIS